MSGGFEKVSGDVSGVDAETKSFCLSSHQIIKLISKQRNSQHRNRMVHCLEQAVLPPMGDKEAHRFVP